MSEDLSKAAASMKRAHDKLAKTLDAHTPIPTPTGNKDEAISLFVPVTNFKTGEIFYRVARTDWTEDQILALRDVLNEVFPPAAKPSKVATLRAQFCEDFPDHDLTKRLAPLVPKRRKKTAKKPSK